MRTTTFLSATAVLLSAGTLSLAAEFRGLSRPAPSIATDISADGATMTGASSNEFGSLPIVWEGADNMVQLTDDFGLPFLGQVNAISDDGKTIVGNATVFSQEQELIIPFYFNVDRRYVTLRAGPDDFSASANGVRPDGEVVVGHAIRAAEDRIVARQWDRQGNPSDLGVLPDFPHSTARDIADNGTVVGTGFDDVGSDAFVWTPNQGMRRMAVLPEYESGFAEAISSNGSFIVGHNHDLSVNEAVIWSSRTEVHGLGMLPGDQLSFANDVTNDGVVVGASLRDSESGVSRATIWDGKRPAREIYYILETANVDVDGWQLTTAIAVSANGRIVLGNGVNPDGTVEAWIAELPELLEGDFNFDGRLDIRDIEQLQSETRKADPLAEFDLDLDGMVDTRDVQIWVRDLKNTWIGDANVDGEFNSGDLVVAFQAGVHETNRPSTWGTGDWNSDGRFDSADLVLAFQEGGFEAGPRGASAVVPEPSSLWLMMIGVASHLGRRHRRRS